MATATVSALPCPQALASSSRKTHLRILSHRVNSHNKHLVWNLKRFLPIHCPPHLSLSLLFPRDSSNGFSDGSEEPEVLPSFEEKSVKFLLWVVFWASVSLAWFAVSRDAKALAISDSIRASSYTLKIAAALLCSSWPD